MVVYSLDGLCRCVRVVRQGACRAYWLAQPVHGMVFQTRALPKVLALIAVASLAADSLEKYRTLAAYIPRCRRLLFAAFRYLPVAGVYTFRSLLFDRIHVWRLNDSLPRGVPADRLLLFLSRVHLQHARVVWTLRCVVQFVHALIPRVLVFDHVALQLRRWY